MDEMSVYKTYQALGEAVLKENSDLSADALTVGKKYYDMYGKQDGIVVAEAESLSTAPPEGADDGGGFLGDAFNMLRGGVQEAQDINTAAQAALRVSPAGRVVSGAEGFVDGMSVDATREIRERVMGQPTDDNWAYETGAFVGELVGPFKLANKLFRGVPALNNSMSGRVMKSGLEGGVVEGAKSVTDLDTDAGDDFSNGAVAFGIDAALEGVVRGGQKAARRVKEWAMKTDVDEELVSLLDGLGLKGYYTPSQVTEGFSLLVAPLQHRVEQGGVATRKIWEMMQRKQQEAMNFLREGFIGNLGDANTKTFTEVGGLIKESLDATASSLDDDWRKLSKKLAESGARDVEIDPNVRVKAEFLSGDIKEMTLYERFEEALGAEALKDNYLPPTSTHKKLGQFLKKWKKASNVGASGLTGGWVQNQNYHYWWKQMQEVGKMFDDPKVKQSDGLRRAVGGVYHAIRDHIDAHAAAVSDTYRAGAAAYRAAWKVHDAFKKHPVYRKVRDRTDVDKLRHDEKIARDLLDSPEIMRQTKQILGPEAFDAMRQMWIRDLLHKSIKQGATGNSYVNTSKLLERIHNTGLGDLDSEYMRELFSDENFFDPAGNPILAQTGAAEKLDMFKDFIEKARRLDLMQQGLNRSGGSLETVAAENVNLDPRPNRLAAQLLQAATNMLFSEKMARRYIRPRDQGNMLFGAPMPPPSDLGGETRRNLQNAMTNRLVTTAGGIDGR